LRLSWPQLVLIPWTKHANYLQRLCRLRTRKSFTTLHLGYTFSVSRTPASIGLNPKEIPEPTVDGSYITNILEVSFLNSQFDPTISVISAHNSNEGFVFTDPAATNSSALETYMEIYFPAADPYIITYISNTLYPPIYDDSQSYTTPFDGLDLLISKMMITCYIRYISTAGNNTYNYMFSVSLDTTEEISHILSGMPTERRMIP
jgi:hypothetical protein